MTASDPIYQIRVPEAWGTFRGQGVLVDNGSVRGPARGAKPSFVLLRCPNRQPGLVETGMGP